jgi:hypothetical protein
MGQTEVYEWLKNQRIELHNEGYFTPKQIHIGLYGETKATPITATYDSLTRLLHAKMLEYQLGGNPISLGNSWSICYRYKMQQK